MNQLSSNLPMIWVIHNLFDERNEQMMIDKGTNKTSFKSEQMKLNLWGFGTAVGPFIRFNIICSD